MEDNIDSINWNKSEKFIIISGCDSGIGRSMADYLSSLGHKLVVTYVWDDHYQENDNVIAVKMDLTIPEDLDHFIEFIHQLCDQGHGIKAVVTNSGIPLGGPVEDIPIENYRKAFDVNFFGAISVIKAALPSIIQEKGKIMIISSMAGRIALPFLSPYASSKFALEGFGDSLRREMNPYGVKTILVEHGGIATPIWNKAVKQDISFVQKKYLKSLYSVRDNFLLGGNKGMDCDLASKETADLLFIKNPKDRYIIDDNKFKSKLSTFVPQRYIDKVVSKMFDFSYGDNQKSGKNEESAN